MTSSTPRLDLTDHAGPVDAALTRAEQRLELDPAVKVGTWD
jgi:hypothetical protein